MLTQAEVYEVLRGHDPEIPLNIVDLRLVYGVTLESVVKVRMTLTASGCSMGG
jgi:metal-sulfur cluster biosynthetic enzyme